MNIDQILDGIQGKSVADLGPNDIPEEVRHRTPDELNQLVQIMEAHARSLHQEDTGEFRDMSPVEEQAFSYALRIREVAMAKLEEHRNLNEVFSRRPAAVKKVYANLRNGLDDHGTVTRMTPYEARDAALRVLDSRSAAAHLRSEEKDQVERHIQTNSDVARRIILTENDAYRNAWMKAMTDPNGIAKLEEDEMRAIRAYDEYRAASSSSGSGGYGVPVFIDPSIILTAQGSPNPFFQISKVVDVNTNAWKGVTSAGVSWSFDAEASETSDDAPSDFLQPTVNIYTARGFVPFSVEIGQDYPAWSSEVANLLAEGYDELLADKFTRGSGSGEPFGVLTVLSASAGNRVKIQTSGSGIGALDPYTIYAALPPRFRTKAAWLMQIGVNNQFRQLGQSNVYHAYTESLPAAWADVILGRSVYESAYMPATTTSTSANSGLAILGDFSSFVIARRAGMTTELVPHLFSTSNPGRPTGQRGVWAYSRIGSNVVNTAAMRLLVNT